MKNLLYIKSDFKYTLRQLIKNPGFSLLSIFVLAGSLGLSAFTFTMAYTAFYKPIPLTHGASIYRLCVGSNLGNCEDFNAFDFSQIRDEITTLQGLGVYKDAVSYLEYETLTKKINVTYTEWNMFQLSESKAFLGRTLQEFDHQAGAESVAVLSYEIWRNFFNGREDIIGTLATMVDEPIEIVGVMPKGYGFPSSTQLWLPVHNDMLKPIENELTSVRVYGRLKTGESLEDANAELDSLMKRVRQLYPLDLNPSILDAQLLPPDYASTARIRSLPLHSISGIQGLLITGSINFLAGLVFLLACINVGTLLLARTNERLKDISIRVALGASRKRLMIQAMSESIVISISGGLLALILAAAGLEMLNLMIASVVPGTLDFWFDFHLDKSTFFAVIVFVICTPVFTSALPCWRIVNGSFDVAMQDGTRGAIGLKPGRFSRSLVVISITLITLLLYIGTVIGAGAIITQNKVLISAAVNQTSASLTLDPVRYSSHRRLLFYRALKERLLQNSNIESILFSRSQNGFGMEQEGLIYESPDELTRTVIYPVSGSLGTIGVSLLQGRGLNDNDNADSQQTAIINRSLAERLWPKQSALGKRIRIRNLGKMRAQSQQSRSTLEENISPWREIVGVVSDFQLGPELALIGTDLSQLYVPLSQFDTNNIVVTVKYNGDADNVSSLLSRTIFELDSELKPYVSNWNEQAEKLTTMVKSIVYLIVGCGLFSFLIAMVGIFGLTKGSITLRTQEIGTIRALGATDKIISRNFLIRGSKQAITGLVLAFLMASPITYLLLLDLGESVLKLVTYSAMGVVFVLYSVILLAIDYPLKEVLKMQPSEALRHV